MHILLITHYYAPEIGAPQRRWSALVRQWREDGFDVTVLCPPPHYPEKVSTGYLRKKHNRPLRKETGEFGETIIRLPYVLHGYLGVVRALDQLVTATAATLVAPFLGKKFSVVISTVPGLPSLFAGTLVSKVLRVPHVAEIRDAWPDVITGDLQKHVGPIVPHKLLLKRAIYGLVTAGQKSADAVVVTTSHFAQKLRDRGVENVYRISNGAEVSTLSPLEPGFLEGRNLRVQYLGTVGRSQGLQVFLEALEILQKRLGSPKIEARIVGSGAEVPYLKELAEAKNFSVEFVPGIPHTELENAYQWADVVLVSLRKTIPFQWTVPSKIFELLGMRRFILGLVEGNAADLIKRSGVGSVVEPENAVALADELERLAANPQELVVGNSGIELLQSSFSYGEMVRRYTAVLNSVAGGCGENP